MAGKVISIRKSKTLTYDRRIGLFEGGHANAKTWHSTSMMWSDLVDKLEKPKRTTETMQEYDCAKAEKQKEIKDVGGFVGGSFKGNRRSAAELSARDLITLDLDNIPAGQSETVLKKVSLGGCASVTYPTRSDRPDRPRYRVVMLLDRTVTPDEYEPVARKTAERLGLLEYCDRTTFQGSRLMFWPSVSKDQPYNPQFIDGPMLSADGMLALFEGDWKDCRKWPSTPDEFAVVRTSLKKQADPTTKSNIIGAFCRTYNIHSAIAKFLPDVYEQAGEDRYTYKKGSTLAGAVVYGDGNFLYSNHATDPCCDRLVNAYDLVRIHLFGEEDAKADVDTPEDKAPSFLKMIEFAQNDSATMGTVRAENMALAMEAFGASINNDALEADKDNWKEKSKNALSWKKNSNEVKATLENAVKILENDPQLKDRFAYDEFTEKVVVKKKLLWGSDEPLREWTDDDDNNLCLVFATAYGFRNKNLIIQALSLVAQRNKFNSVKNYLDGLKWDGTPRIEDLLHDYLGAEKNEYTAQVMKVTLVGAIKRAVIGGTKWDYVPILVGPQGLGKSKFLHALGREWFSDSLQSFEGKDAAELIQGKWINEIPELAAFSKSETNKIKMFITKQEDHFRAAYTRNPVTRKRRCIFIGTTNDDEFLKDSTGNRRYWPVQLAVTEPELPIDSLIDDPEHRTIDQIWAEAYELFKEGKTRPWLTGEAAEMAIVEQSNREIHDEWTGIIEAYLNTPVPENWQKMSLEQRRAYLADTSQLDGTQTIDRTCVVEIWCEAFNGDPQKLDYATSRRISAVMNRIEGWEPTKLSYRSYVGPRKGFIRKQEETK